MEKEIYCIVANDANEWEETLRVKSLETAESDVKEIIQQFNSTLRPGEKARRLVCIVGEKTIEMKTAGDKIKDFHGFLGDLRHEHANPFGNAWLRTKFPLLMKAYNTLVETGESKMLNKYVRECIQNVRDIPDKFHYLENVDIVGLFKEMP